MPRVRPNSKFRRGLPQRNAVDLPFSLLDSRVSSYAPFTASCFAFYSGKHVCEFSPDRSVFIGKDKL